MGWQYIDYEYEIRLNLYTFDCQLEVDGNEMSTFETKAFDLNMIFDKAFIIEIGLIYRNQDSKRLKMI